MRTVQKNNISPQRAMELLKDGNTRFVSNLKINRNLLQQVNDTKEGQYPFAAILSCMDSRTSAELVFDQGLGDICSIRVAGNILNDDVIGSLEYACHALGSKIIVVLGHTKCGAIKGAVDGVKLGNVTQLLQKIYPAVKKVRASDLVMVHGAVDIYDAVAEQNVHLTIEKLVNSSDILKKMIDDGAVGIVGAMYDIESGIVTFYDEDIRMNVDMGCRSEESV